MCILGDIGGTKTRISFSKNLDDFNDPIIFETPKSYKSALKKFNEVLGSLSEPQAICFGVAGVFSKSRDKLLTSPHLPDWAGRSLKLDIYNITKCENIFLENDTAIVGLGEVSKILRSEVSNIVYITISTGVGGVKIENGKIGNNTYGFEPGHQIIKINHDLKTLEQLVSGSGIKSQTGKEAYEIKDESFWDLVIKNIAIGIHNTIVYWSPEIIILGGGVGQKLSIDKIICEVEKLLKIFPKAPDIVRAQLGDLGGIVGAIEFLKNKIKL